MPLLTTMPASMMMPMYACMLNDVPVSLSASTTPMRRRRHREHDDERIAQRLVLRRHHRVDEHQRENQHHAQLVECLRLLLDFGAEADAEVLRHAVQLRQPLPAPPRPRRSASLPARR